MDTQAYLDQAEPGETVEQPEGPIGLNFEAGPVNEETGSANRYVITGFNADTNPAALDGDNRTEAVLLFQNGVIPEVGKNGVTPEILVDILIHKFEGFQSGKFACDENEQALAGLRAAKAAIESRLAARRARGVEGTHVL